jgi:3-hydroxyisobutyrate dehydrogenase-like beta-hydroxyacid dehydrogenase
MGQVANTCNNLVLGITMAGVAEAMSLGAALGIDPKVLAGIINTSTGRCWSSDTYNRPDGEVSEYSGSDLDRARSAIANVGRASSEQDSGAEEVWFP